MDRRLGVVGLAVLAVVATVVLRGALASVGRLVIFALLVAFVVGVAVVLTGTPAYSRTTVGTGERVVHRSIPSSSDATCDECGESAAGGRRHRFVREAVVFGVPVLLLEDGANDYCPACTVESD